MDQVIVPFRCRIDAPFGLELQGIAITDQPAHHPVEGLDRGNKAPLPDKSSGLQRHLGLPFGLWDLRARQLVKKRKRSRSIRHATAVRVNRSPPEDRQFLANSAPSLTPRRRIPDQVRPGPCGPGGRAGSQRGRDLPFLRTNRSCRRTRHRRHAPCLRAHTAAADRGE